MRNSKTALAMLAILAAAASVGAQAQGHARAGASQVPSAAYGFGHLGAHPYSGVRAPAAPSAGRAIPPRHVAGYGHPGARPPVGHLPPPRIVAHRARVGLIVGVPVYAPLLYSAPAYYYPPPVTYVEQAPAYAEPAPDYWYFCPELNAYYPYVQECPGAWQPVLPQSPG